MRLALVLLFTLSAALSFTLPTRGGCNLRCRAVRASAKCCVAADAGGQESPDDLSAPSTFDPSRDFSTFQQGRSKGSAVRFAITQAGPLRRGVSAVNGVVNGAIDSLSNVFRFYRGIARIIPVRAVILLVSFMAFGRCPQRYRGLIGAFMVGTAVWKKGAARRRRQ